MSEQDLRYADITRAILGAAFEVHRVLGPGFLESIYEESLAHELGLRGLHSRRQVDVPICYKGIRVGTHILDLLVEDKVVVELKAIKELADIHAAIVLSYLSATHLHVALLINFGKSSLEHKRLVR